MQLFRAPNEIIVGASALPPTQYFAAIETCLLVHRVEEILVGLGILHLVEEEFHRVDCTHLHKDTAQHPHLGELVLLDQQLFLARTRFADVQSRENALIRNLAVDNDFLVTCALELFKDHFVHTAAGINQRSRNDGE